VQNTIKLTPEIEKLKDIIIKCLSKGNKIVLFAKGVSEVDAQHIAAELIGRFKLE